MQLMQPEMIKYNTKANLDIEQDSQSDQIIEIEEQLHKVEVIDQPCDILEYYVKEVEMGQFYEVYYETVRKMNDSGMKINHIIPFNIKTETSDQAQIKSGNDLMKEYEQFQEQERKTSKVFDSMGKQKFHDMLCKVKSNLELEDDQKFKQLDLNKKRSSSYYDEPEHRTFNNKYCDEDMIVIKYQRQLKLNAKCSGSKLDSDLNEIDIEKLKSMQSYSIETMRDKKQNNQMQKIVKMNYKNPQDLDDFMVEDEQANQNNSNIMNIQDQNFNQQEWEQMLQNESKDGNLLRSSGRKQKSKHQVNKILTYSGRNYDRKNQNMKDQCEDPKLKRMKTQNDINEQIYIRQASQFQKYEDINRETQNRVEQQEDYVRESPNKVEQQDMAGFDGLDIELCNSKSRLQSNSRQSSIVNDKNYEIQDLIQENMQASRNITLWIQKNQEKNKMEQQKRQQMMQKVMDTKQVYIRAASSKKVENKVEQNPNVTQTQVKNKLINNQMYNSCKDENKGIVQKDFQQKLEIFKQQFNNQSHNIQMSKHNIQQQNDKLIQFKKSLDNLDKQRKIMHKKIEVCIQLDRRYWIAKYRTNSHSMRTKTSH